MRKYVQPIFTHGQQDSVNDEFASLRSDLSLYKELSDLNRDVNSNEIKKSLTELKKKLQHTIDDIQKRRGISFVTLLSKTGAQLFKAYLIDAQQKIEDFQKKTGDEFQVTDFVAEDNIYRQPIVDPASQLLQELTGKNTQKLTLEQLERHPRLKEVTNLLKQKKVEVMPVNPLEQQKIIEQYKQRQEEKEPLEEEKEPLEEEKEPLEEEKEPLEEELELPQTETKEVERKSMFIIPNFTEMNEEQLKNYIVDFSEQENVYSKQIEKMFQKILKQNRKLFYDDKDIFKNEFFQELRDIIARKGTDKPRSQTIIKNIDKLRYTLFDEIIPKQIKQEEQKEKKKGKKPQRAQ